MAATRSLKSVLCGGFSGTQYYVVHALNVYIKSYAAIITEANTMLYILVVCLCPVFVNVKAFCPIICPLTKRSVDESRFLLAITAHIVGHRSAESGAGRGNAQWPDDLYGVRADPQLGLGLITQ